MAAIGDLQPNDLEGLLKAMDPARNGYESPFRMITFLGNHDHKRPMQIIGEGAQCSGDMAFRRMMLGHGMLLGMAGIPMIWMGTEFGMIGEKSAGPQPLNWSLLDHPENAALMQAHQRAIRLRREAPALCAGHFQGLLCDPQRMLLAWKRWNDEGSVALVLANVADQDAGDVTVEDGRDDDGEWVDRYTGDVFRMEQGKITTPLGRSQVRLLVRS